jgi:hypothetical protein
LPSVSRRAAAAVIACVLAAACGSAQPRGHGPSAATTTASTVTSTVPRHTVRAKRRLPVHVVTGPVTAIGDSVMIDAAPALRTILPAVMIDAAVNRSALPGPALLLALARSGRLGSSILIDLGTNGGVSAPVVDEMLGIAAGRRVVMVTSHCGYCSWTPAGNAIIRSTCTRARNCRVADWDTLARAHPSWFAGDGVHMVVGGQGAYAYCHLVQVLLAA